MSSILQVRNVNKSFAGLKALNNVELSVEEGAVHAIIGPNGAGKSTLLNCFVGRLTPDTGTVDFNGISLLGKQPHEINQTGVVRVFQTPEIFGDLSLLENVMIPTLARRDGSFKLNGWSRVDGIAEVRDRAEPTAGMSRADTNKTIDLLKQIGERGITKIVIEHDMHVVFSLAHKISVMAQGTVIAEGAPEQIKGDPRVQEAYLGGAHL